MGFFADMYGGTPDFSLGESPSFGASRPLPMESTGIPVDPSGLPAWASTGLNLFGGVLGSAASALGAYNQLRKPNGTPGADYTPDQAARERENYNVPRQVGIPTWAIVLGVVVVGVLAYKIAE